MMQEHFYTLYVFTVQSNGGVATLLVDFEDLPYRVRSYTPFLHQNDHRGCPRSY